MNLTDILARLSGVKSPPRLAPAPAPALKPAEAWPLSQPLLYHSPHAADAWTIGDACEGCQIFGGTGSGKTSGSGQHIAKAFLRAGFGGLILTAKPDESAEWQRYCSAPGIGREKNLILFGPGHPYRFNFLRYEYTRPGEGAGLTENVVALFAAVLEAAGRKKEGGGSDPYWQSAQNQLLRNAIDLVRIAYEGTDKQVGLADINDVIANAASDPRQLQDEDWQAESRCWELLETGRVKVKTPEQAIAYDRTRSYWTREYPSLAEKTRSVIVSLFTSMVDPLLRGIFHELFCTGLNFVPELTEDGAIIVLDMPVEKWNETGLYAQMLMKYLWQRAMSRRDPASSGGRPVFLWADESQYFVSSQDAKFQATARSKRACTVYLTQNRPNYAAVLHSDAATDALLGNFQTKIFHANGDPKTNQWASDSIGRKIDTRGSYNTSREGQTSYGASETLEYKVQPAEFHDLKSGGERNACQVEAYIFKPSRRWAASGETYIKRSFDQNNA